VGLRYGLGRRFRGARSYLKINTVFKKETGLKGLILR